MSKKILSILVCAVLMLLCLGGCGETKDKTNQTSIPKDNSSNTSSEESSDIEAGDIILPEGFDPEKLPYDGNPIVLPEEEV